LKNISSRLFTKIPLKDLIEQGADLTVELDGMYAGCILSDYTEELQQGTRNVESFYSLQHLWGMRFL
jgi:hypothetical protein